MLQLIGQIEWGAAPRMWVLAALPLVLIAAWWGAPRLDRRRRVATALVRVLAVACIVFAWAGPAWRGPTDRTWLVLTEDRSVSVVAGTANHAPPQIEPISGSQAPATTSRLEFAGGTQGPGEKNTAADSKSLNGFASDPALAVRRAAATVPADYVPAIQLATDGRAMREGLFAAAVADGAPLDAISIPAFPSPEVCASEVRAPLVARPGESFDVEVIVTANHDDQGQLEFQAGSDPSEKRPVQLHAGSNSFTFRGGLGNSQAAAPLRATISDCRDTHPENNTRRAIVSAGARPRVLLVGKPPNVSWPLLTAVQGNGFDAQAVAVAELPASRQGYESIDLVILSGIASGQPTRQQQQALQQFVREQGGGLIVLGDGPTFDPAALAGSWLEELLPVTALHARTDPPPRMALVLVIDKSQSMLDDHKLDLAKEAARRTVGLSAIAARDEVGVLAFSDDSRWISPLAPCSDKKRLLAAIDTLQADGATNMAPAMERARLALVGADVDRRHMILLTDGVSTPGDFSRLAAKMAAAGITVSTVAVGREADPTLLKDISRAAGGRHYQCDDPNDVPKMLVAEVQQAAGAQGRAAFEPMVYQQLPGLSIAGAPRLSSFTPTSPKPQSELLLLAPGGDPLLAWGRQGQGIVVALTTSLDAGAKQWQTWAGFGPFWNRLVRHALRVRTPRFEVATERRFGQLAVTVDARAEDGRPLNGVDGELSLRHSTAANGSEGNETSPAAKRPLVQVAPGIYRAVFDTTAVGRYDATVALHGGGATGEFHQAIAMAVDYPDELQLGPSDESLLKSVAAATGGRFVSDIAKPPAVTEPSVRRQVERVIPLGTLLALAALILLVVEVAMRRVANNLSARSAAAADARQDHTAGHWSLTTSRN